MPENLQIILRFFSFFSDFLGFSLIFSEFLGFSSYLCTRKSAAHKKGCGVIIFKKVLKNDEALPSAMDSRAFFLWRPDGIAGNGEPKLVKAIFTFLPLSDYPSSKSTI